MKKTFPLQARLNLSLQQGTSIPLSKGAISFFFSADIVVLFFVSFSFLFVFFASAFVIFFFLPCPPSL